MSLKRLLYMSENPPGQAGGAAIIARQHLREYDPALLHVLCDRGLYRTAKHAGSDALLPCPHTTVPNFEFVKLRPRRIFGRMFDIVNLARIPLIKRRAKAIIAREGIEAIFTIPWRTDFALAAHLVARETGLPLYVFEMDDWHAANPGPVVTNLTGRWQAPLLQNAAHVWLISPEMTRRYHDRFGIEGEFLFHFVDPDIYQEAEPRELPTAEELRLVYTGSINRMFLGTLERIAEWVNAGMEIGGKRVVLDIWSAACPEQLRGPGVRWHGFVPSHEVPGILAGADALLIAITFSDDPALQDLVRSSIYTKTVDYLASSKPVVVVSPSDTAELDYFGSVVWPVANLEQASFEDAVEQATTSDEAMRRSDAGLALIRANHTAETMGERFLSRLRTRDSDPTPDPALP
jgi:glycosyltransferase involved in cell wall biosynthesis